MGNGNSLSGYGIWSEDGTHQKGGVCIHAQAGLARQHFGLIFLIVSIGFLNTLESFGLKRRGYRIWRFLELGYSSRSSLTW